jgi:hypothetical protein
MLFHNDIIAGAQPESRSLTGRFGGKKRAEYPGPDSGRNSRTIVCNIAIYIGFILPGSDSDVPSFRPILLFNGLDTVQDQVQEHIIDLFAETENLWQLCEMR